jgi:uncharacterized membrane protein YhaH (DUF805 family)
MLSWAWLFSFNGRIGRGRFWITLLVYLAILIPLGILAEMMQYANTGGLRAFLLLALAVLSVLTGISSLAVSAKRFHDRGKTGWLLLLAGALNLIGEALAGDYDNPNVIGVVILLGVTVWLVIDLGIMPGEAGPNTYGPDPRA